MRRLVTDRLLLSALGVVLVFVVAVAYIFAEVLDQPLTSRPATVQVELARSGGLFEGSGVTYRGVKVGKVTEIVPAAEGVVATVRLTSGTDIPQRSRARVRSLSPVGEQYLDFQPMTSEGPFLQDGDTISAAATDLPESLSSTVVAVSDVLEQIDDRRLRVLLDELSTGLAGTGDDLGQVLDQGNDLLATLERVWPQTDRLITNGGRVTDLVVRNADSLRLLGTRGRQLARFLRDYSPELSRTLRRAPGQVAELTELVEDAQEVLPGFLTVGVSFTDMVMSYEPHLRALLQEYAPGIRALMAVLHGDRLNVQIIPKRTRRCDYDSTRQDPWNPERRPFYLDGRCPASFANLRRGAAHAPGPVR